MTSSSLACLLLGEEPLVIRCAEVLRERGHRIAGVVTAAQGVKLWCEDHAVPVLGRGEYGAVLERGDIDVLLSITHPALIKPEHIAKAKLAALNYHDGPLPRYAGMNGSAWALANGEREHAIVWHHLTAGLDEGDVLERRDVALDARETSVSLNMGHSARALESFTSLVRRIEARELQGTPQRTDIERTVFSRYDRPPHACVIDWSLAPRAIDALVRACEFGKYPNRFGAMKAVHIGARDGHEGARAVIVRECEPTLDLGLDQGFGQGVGGAGTVLEITDDAIAVACGAGPHGGALRLRRFTTLTGAALTPREAAAALDVQPGSSLVAPLLDATASRKIAESEPYWAPALARRVVPQLPFEAKPGAPARVDVRLPPAFLNQWRAAAGASLADAMAALHVLTLSCSVADDTFDVVDETAAAGAACASSESATLCFRGAPLRVSIDASKGFAHLVSAIAAERAALARRAPILLDLVARHPSLRDQPELRAGELSSVALVDSAAGGSTAGTSAGTAAVLPPGARIGVALGADGCALWSDGRVELATLESIARQMEAVAAKVAADAQRPLAKVDALDDMQRRRQVFEWNATQRSFPDTLRIHELFELQVDARPDATALVFEGQTLTFAQLEERANRIARALQARGAKPGQYVAILVERGFDLVASLIGVSKSGAAYLPIDPGYPEDRVRFMLADAKCATILASRELASIAGPGAPILAVDDAAIATASGARPACPARPGDVCYAIYTSGSTGMPKGVVLTHRAVVNTLDWVNRVFEVGPRDRLLFVTSPSFDLSVYDVFGALGAGASVEVASARLLKEPALLTRHLIEGGITIWDSAPPALARLATFFPDEPAAVSKLRLTMLSGDWIPVWLPDAMKRVFKDVNVKSLGGATEAAIWSNYFHVGKVDPAWTSIPYGYPIQNARYYILDRHLRPVPMGIPGDLYIAGTCLAEGYLNRKELTDERFIPDPFVTGATPSERMYKTGDLARYWADGAMEFLGRADFQVKIRGFRIEMGEVEAAIRALPDVRDALCATWIDGASQKSLVAYVVPAVTHGVQAQLDAHGIKETLAAKLPDFMVPSHIITLRALPLSANGKLDRKALPSPADDTSATAYREPVTSVEKALADIWQQVLKKKPIGTRDNFFDLGGHSLLAVMLMAELKKRMNVELPLSRIIESPTIEALAAYMGDGAASDTGTTKLIELKPGRSRCLFLVHDGDGETLLYRTLARMMPADFAVYGVAPRSLPRIPMADTSVEAMATSYLAEVRKRQPHGPYYFGGLCAGGVIAFEMALRLERAGERVELVALLDAVEPSTRTRPFQTGSQRIQRLRALLPHEPAVAEVVRATGAVMRKARNAAQYEVTSRLRSASARARYRLLQEVMTRGREWPTAIPPLSVRQVYIAAREGYACQGKLRGARVVLVKATEGHDADQPAMDQFDDPLLGWQAHAEKAIETINMSGGHSSMLQAPHVEKLAARLKQLLT